MKLKLKHNLTTTAIVLAAVSAVYGDTQPATPPPAELSTQEEIDKTILDAFTKGKFSANIRLRYEYADQSAPARSAALTVRPRFGFTTAPVYGFQSMIEAENVTLITDESEVNLAGTTGQPGRTAIADPETTEINQVWLSYSNWDTTAKGGIQRMVLDNHRFIGDVGWRQNQQTYQAASIENKTIKDVSLFYSYVWGVNRVFGGQSPLAGTSDFDSDSHLINIAYSGLKCGKIVGYTYLLDFDNSAANSTATYGASFAGNYVWDKEHGGKVNYRGEFAWQTDYGSSTLDYQTEYYNVEVSGDYDRYSVGVGYEVLGSDNGQGFKTPLATLHAFNGWADVFLTTPATGLTDFYAFVGAKLPGNIPVKAVYHKFDADTGGADFGWEIDVVASRQFGKYFTALVKYAHYDGMGSPFAFDKDVFWAQLEFNY